MQNFIKKYKHASVMAVYSVIYMILFAWLEARPVHSYHVIHTVFDDMIPFCEYFIVPYLLWFPYVFLVVCYFIFFNKNKKEYYQLIGNLMMGMTLFLVVSYFYPNIQHLRPESFAHDNIFTAMVAHLYATDTPTNILPSIHVFNSLAIHMALTNCEQLQEKKWLHTASFVLAVSIILSTMFLKQHSVIDVCLGATLALFGYLLFYPQHSMATQTSFLQAKQHTAKHRQHQHSH
ncbi:MAG: phosphatase PAP2 family protein [Eubacteriales bacterium]|nr:phosphatase PAP2 family protein [Eubacteriales bacterium]